MIVKMKFINISGPRDGIDRVTDLYLSRYEIQLESALSELKTGDNLRPFGKLRLRNFVRNSNCSLHSAPSTVIFTRSSDIDILHIVSDGSRWNLITR